MTDRPDQTTLLMFAATALLAGANFVGIRFSNAELSPFFGAGVRFLPAAALLFLVMAATRVRFPRGRGLAAGLVYGVLGVGGFYAFAYLGMVRATAATAAVVLATVPLATFVLAWLHGLERFSWRKIAGGALAVGGIVLLATTRGGSVVLADGGSVLALVMATLCVSEASVLLKWFPETHPISTNAIGVAAGGLLLLAVSGVLHLAGGAGEAWVLPVQTSTWLALGYLVVIGTVVLFFLFISLIRRWTASSTTYIFLTAPFIAAILGAILLHEPITWTLAASGLLVALGVYIGAISVPNEPSVPLEAVAADEPQS